MLHFYDSVACYVTLVKEQEQVREVREKPMKEVQVRGVKKERRGGYVSGTLYLPLPFFSLPLNLCTHEKAIVNLE